MVGRKESECGQIGVRRMPGIDGIVKAVARVIRVRVRVRVDRSE